MPNQKQEIDLDHYKLLQRLAKQQLREGGRVRVKLAEYWIGGRQQTDFYTITWPGSCQGPMSFSAAYDWLIKQAQVTGTTTWKYASERVVSEEYLSRHADNPYGENCGSDGQEQRDA